MRRKNIVLALLLVIGTLILSPIVKAEGNESSLLENVYINYGQKGENSPFSLIYFTLKEDVNLGTFFVEFYDKSLSEMPAVHSAEFRITTLENPSTKEEYDASTPINFEGTLPKGTKLYYYGEKKLFEQEKINIVANWETEDMICNEEIDYEVIDGGIRNLTVVKNNSYAKNNDTSVYESFMNEYKKKYPHITPYIGDANKMEFAYNSTNINPETDIYIPVGSITFAGKTLEELMKEMDALVNAPLTAQIPEKNKIESKDNILKTLKDNKVSTTYENTKNNTLIYAWTFDGNKMTENDTTLNINLDIVIGETENKDKINALVPASMPSLKIDFKHSGALPTGTSIKLNVGNNFKNEDNLDLYYYNQEKNELEKVVENITVIDGYVTFPLTHCSEYVLVVNNEAKKDADNNVQTSSMNVILYAIISIVSASALAYILKNKSKEIA